MTAWELDPDLLCAAAHELGHAVTNLAAGFRVYGITVNTRTGAGRTELDLLLGDDTPPATWAGWLIACVAGFEAEALWCRHHGGRPDPRNSTTDFATFRRHRRRAGLSESAARSAARTILRRNWRHIERCAPDLAQRGHLAVSALGKQGGRWW